MATAQAVRLVLVEKLGVDVDPLKADGGRWAKCAIVGPGGTFLVSSRRVDGRRLYTVRRVNGKAATVHGGEDAWAKGSDATEAARTAAESDPPECPHCAGWTGTTDCPACHGDGYVASVPAALRALGWGA